MLPALADYLAELTAVQSALEEALDGLPAEAVNWAPGPEINSMAVLATHTAGSQRYWIGEVVGGEPVVRDRAEEFRAVADDGATLIAGLRLSFEHSRGVLERLTQADLDRAIHTSQGGDTTAYWPLAHALKHTSEHMAHLQITRQLWDQRGG